MKPDMIYNIQLTSGAGIEGHFIIFLIIMAITALLSIFLDLLIIVLPFVIYRYAIKKTTIEHKKALCILIIYAICLFILLCILNAISGTYGARFTIFEIFCFVIDYRLLTGKWYKRKEHKKQKFMEHSALFPDMDDHHSTD